MFDVAIVGLGAMGSAAAWQLASRGAAIVGLDRFEPPHAFGSTHGRSRIIREAYFEHPLYVTLVQRAYQLWGALERSRGETIFYQTGGLMIGPPGGLLVRGAAQSAKRHDLPCEAWEARDVRLRVPALAPSDDMVAIWEPRAGVLRAEEAVTAMLGEARRLGADLRLGTTVIGWSGHAAGVAVETVEGSIEARHLVLAAGPWTSELTGDLGLPLTLERAVQGWFPPRDPAAASPASLPIFILEDRAGRLSYGLPDLGEGVKLAEHHGGEVTTLAGMRREVDASDRHRLEALARQWVPGVLPALDRATTCIYTNTPDQHFVIDRHPAEPRVVIVSACSGHGFKFAPAIGEIVADLAAGRQPAFDLSRFSLARFAHT